MDMADRMDDSDIITKDTAGTDTLPMETVTRKDLEVFNDYLVEVTTSLLGLESHEYFNKFIQAEENLNKIMAFVTDKQHRVLVVSKTEEFSKVIEDKDEAKDAAQDEIEEDIVTDTKSKSQSIVNIEIDLKVSYKGGDAQNIAFIKRQQTAAVNLKEGKRSMSKQLQVINTGYAGEEIDLFRMANIYLDNGLIPLFTSYKMKKNQDDAIYNHIDEIEQLLSKLRMEFVHCSQDQMSLEVKLLVDQRILAKKELADSEKRLLTEEDFIEEMKDNSFQDALSNCLRVWTKDIQKITYMNTDFPIDSVLTEITFWTNREHALQSIQDQLSSVEVETVLNLINSIQGMSMKVLTFKQNINVVQELKKAQEYSLILKD